MIGDNEPLCRHLLNFARDANFQFRFGNLQIVARLQTQPGLKIIGDTVFESNSSHSFKRGVMLDLVAVQVDHREAPFVVTPNRFAAFNAKRLEAGSLGAVFPVKAL